MILDALLSFVPIGGNLSLVGGAGITIPSTNVIDLIGSGEGTTPPNIIGTPTLFGTDMGIGDDKLQIRVYIGTALATSSSAVLSVRMQAAPDTAVTHVAGTWQDLVTVKCTAAQGTAGAVIARIDWPPAVPPNLNARYVRLLFDPGTGASFTAGTISSAIVTPVGDDWSAAYAAKNYVVG